MKVRKSSYCSINILFTNFHTEHEYSPILISKYTSNQNPEPVYLSQTYLPNSHLNIKQHSPPLPPGDPNGGVVYLRVLRTLMKINKLVDLLVCLFVFILACVML